jgi:hypothetical protein
MAVSQSTKSHRPAQWLAIKRAILVAAACFSYASLAALAVLVIRMVVLGDRP